MKNKTIKKFLQKVFIREIESRITEQVKQGYPREPLERLAFSILVMIDGEAVDIPPFALRPINNKGKEGPDIAGKLHHKLLRSDFSNEKK